MDKAYLDEKLAQIIKDPVTSALIQEFEPVARMMVSKTHLVPEADTESLVLTGMLVGYYFGRDVKEES